MKPQELRLPIELATLQDLLRKHQVLHASIFGSYARGEATTDSDLDVLVSYAPGVSLFDHFDLKEELESYSGKKVDVVSERALSRHIRPYIERDKVVIL
jgi:predicted nucleotidyltransferase